MSCSKDELLNHRIAFSTSSELLFVHRWFGVSFPSTHFQTLGRSLDIEELLKETLTFVREKLLYVCVRAAVNMNIIFSEKEHTKWAEKVPSIIAKILSSRNSNAYALESNMAVAQTTGCDIIVNKDKGVSRVHAEIIVDEMICLDHLAKRHSNNSSKVRIRDCSKYGTFISKNLVSKEKVHELPNRETMLKDGDIVAFGTGNAKYRFSFVSLVFCAPSFEMNQLQDKMSLIGATVTRTWTSKSTHMVLEDYVQIDDDIVDAIVARKPLVRFSWIEVELPLFMYSRHAPTLTLEGASLKVTDPQSREQCLRGYTFLLESIYKSLGDNKVYVMPAGSTSSNGGFSKFNSVRMVKEMELISAVVSGHLDPSVMASAPGKYFAP
ncbi:Nijmegen breakage syndrome 1 protein [Sesamum angolense]|uniref:Nijmegen breakage syndrome 1 protein n=1 Tax=Sesamum angolense TaxID=2727404 RepID=A0AAE2C528_9LAMI|nr:Nijmegen breakage syndrome 1 protein [Sesamum angolense]